MTLQVPARVPWPIHRVATAGYYTDALETICTRWSLVDVVDANAVIDAWEDAKARIAATPQKNR